MRRPTVSFCTTCFNRSSQLRATFAENAARISDDPFCEWIIVDYGSRDAPHDFVFESLPRLPPRIEYHRERSGHPWHLSVAKNMAHRLARGDILVNLDCDNFVADAIDIVRRFFPFGIDALHMWSGTRRDGTSGRIAVQRDAFLALGGYDESFYPMGYQDLDLLERLSHSGRTVLSWPCADGAAIANSKVESVAHCATDGMSWEDFDRLNRMRSAQNLAAGRLVANERGMKTMKTTAHVGEVGARAW